MNKVVTGSSLAKALAKAQNVGVVEESFTLDKLDITVRSLRPEEYESILAECDGLDDIVYFHRLSRSHAAWGLVQIGDTDLRGISFVEDEAQDDKGRVKKVRVELHKWVDTNILSTWGRESIQTVYRKVTDAIEQAEKQAKQGITFLVPDETDEEQARRLLGEARDALETLPAGIRQRVLDDHGLIEQSTAAEIKAAQERLDAVQRAEEGKTAHPMTEGPEDVPEAVDVPGPSEEDLAVLREGLKQAPRQPLNQIMEVVDIPSAPTPKPGLSRAALLAQEAAESARSLGLADDIPIPVPGVDTSSGAPVEIRPQQRRSLEDAAAIIDPPPPVGHNRLFKPPFARLGHARRIVLR